MRSDDDYGAQSSNFLHLVEPSPSFTFINNWLALLRVRFLESSDPRVIWGLRTGYPFARVSFRPTEIMWLSKANAWSLSSRQARHSVIVGHLIMECQVVSSQHRPPERKALSCLLQKELLNTCNVLSILHGTLRPKSNPFVFSFLFFQVRDIVNQFPGTRQCSFSIAISWYTFWGHMSHVFQNLHIVRLLIQWVRFFTVPGEMIERRVRTVECRQVLSGVSRYV